MRNKDLTNAERIINYLTKQLNSTSIADMQTIFYPLIKERTKTIMLANIRPYYVLEIIDPAVVLEDKIEPKRPIICFLIILLGGCITIFLVVINLFLRKVHE